MQLENYFEFIAPNDIRLKGHRIGIETILYEYLFKAKTPEEIRATYHTLKLEEVYATILYYLENKKNLDQYMESWLDWGHQQREKQRLNPTPIIQKLQQYKFEKIAQQNGN
jgi:uncharacterized protein (DUF433 family)